MNDIDEIHIETMNKYLKLHHIIKDTRLIIGAVNLNVVIIGY
jgi:hypothetical protein